MAFKIPPNLETNSGEHKNVTYRLARGCHKQQTLTPDRPLLRYEGKQFSPIGPNPICYRPNGHWIDLLTEAILLISLNNTYANCCLHYSHFDKLFRMQPHTTTKTTTNIANTSFYDNMTTFVAIYGTASIAITTTTTTTGTVTVTPDVSTSSTPSTIDTNSTKTTTATTNDSYDKNNK
ncbi:unnamed protein product [Protopolystoma xenopodis]|uniref:Uncharacterized protein n=1 Tax=Protopolystoma xenopodis TaxID=117903 RepID=A0A3S5CDV1_9PLAT|nr:unnamed protein product [Protopolystoma xenopodis]